MTEYMPFFIIGCIQLAINSYKDLKNGLVDDRYNYLMMGIVLYAYFISGLPFWYLAIFLGLNLVMSLACAKSGFGQGDISAFNWITLGYAVINPNLIILFWIGILLFTTLQKVLIKRAMPLFPLILILFIVLFAYHVNF